MSEVKTISKDIFKDCEVVDVSSQKDKDENKVYLEVKGDAFVSNLPEGITKATYKKLQDYEKDFATAAFDYCTDKADAEFSSNKNTKTVNVKVQFGDSMSSNINCFYQRTKSGLINGKEYASSLVNVQVNKRYVMSKLIDDVKAKFTEKYNK